MIIANQYFKKKKLILHKTAGKLFDLLQAGDIKLFKKKKIIKSI